MQSKNFDGCNMNESIFKHHTVNEIYDEIRTVYLSDNRPWILGFSGGKDSTCMTQLIWNALASLPRNKLEKNIYIISSDTLVESPKIVSTVIDTLQQMGDAAKKINLPISTNLVRPRLENTFWVCLLGKGYPAPSNTFRWCTDRLKITSANDFINNKVSEYGEVVVVLGSRKDESSTRAQVLNLHSIEGSPLSSHSTLPQAFVYAPLRDFLTEDVWSYLLQTKKNPWGGNNRDLLVLYQNANSSECPLVVDTSTASCGNSRFGCWTCTVVEKDKSMENLIDSGETWMEPLLELRQELKNTQDPEVKKKVRDYKHRNGRIIYWKEKLAMGRYKFEFCRDFLEKLLLAQVKIQKEGPDKNLMLINTDEIHEIQRIWRMECGDWKDSAYSIYKKITGNKISAQNDLGRFGHIEQTELDKACKEHNIDPVLPAKLLHAEFATTNSANRQSVHKMISKILSEEWRLDITAVLKDADKHMKRLKVVME